MAEKRALELKQEQLLSHFEKMITDKYSTDFEKMTPEKRNNRLREMLSKDMVIVFPEKQFVDGLPEIKIMN